MPKEGLELGGWVPFRIMLFQSPFKVICQPNINIIPGSAGESINVVHNGFLREYRRRDSNPHVLRHTPLKRACLPIPPLRQLNSKIQIPDFKFETWNLKLTSAQNWTRTSTPFRALPPQSSASTNFATWAALRATKVIRLCSFPNHQTLFPIQTPSPVPDRQSKRLAVE